MRRRHFLTTLGAAAVAPALPALGAGAPVAQAAAGYNRYQYGLAVFHARTRAGLTAADLMGRLHISAAQAHAMMSEMSASGVLTRGAGIARATAGTRAAAAKSPLTRAPYVRRALRRMADHSATDTPVSHAQVPAQAAAPAARISPLPDTSATRDSGSEPQD